MGRSYWHKPLAGLECANMPKNRSLLKLFDGTVLRHSPATQSCDPVLRHSPDGKMRELWAGGKSRQIRAIAARRHVFDGNKLQRGRIYAVAQTGRGWPVVENMAQMTVAMA